MQAAKVAIAIAIASALQMITVKVLAADAPVSTMARLSTNLPPR
jgi:hypothetical protein